MRFVLGLPYASLDEYVPLARRAEELGFEGVQLADHVAIPERIDSPYPYSRSGRPAFDADVPWPDPFVVIGAMAQATTSIRFYTRVYVLPLRNPFVAAKAVGTAAALSGNRVVFGVGAGWLREEFELLGQDFSGRGERMDEEIEVLRALWCGPAEYHGRWYDFDRVEMLPRPSEPVPIYVGGESAAALRRAARLGDGFMSVPHRRETLGRLARRLAELRESMGRIDEPFDFNALCTDAREAEDFAALEELGITSTVVRPWSTSQADGSLVEKERSMETFANTIVAGRTG